jgi:hypothetical protein
MEAWFSRRWFDLAAVIIGACSGLAVADAATRSPTPGAYPEVTLSIVIPLAMPFGVWIAGRLRKIEAPIWLATLQASLYGALLVAVAPHVPPFSRWWPTLRGLLAAITAAVGYLVAGWIHRRWPPLASRAQKEGVGWLLTWSVMSLIVCYQLFQALPRGASTLASFPSVSVGSAILPIIVLSGWCIVGRESRPNPNGWGALIGLAILYVHEAHSRLQSRPDCGGTFSFGSGCGGPWAVVGLVIGCMGIVGYVISRRRSRSAPGGSSTVGDRLTDL